MKNNKYTNKQSLDISSYFKLVIIPMIIGVALSIILIIFSQNFLSKSSTHTNQHEATQEESKIYYQPQTK